MQCYRYYLSTWKSVVFKLKEALKHEFILLVSIIQDRSLTFVGVLSKMPNSIQRYFSLQQKVLTHMLLSFAYIYRFLNHVDILQSSLQDTQEICFVHHKAYQYANQECESGYTLQHDSLHFKTIVSNCGFQVQEISLNTYISGAYL